MDTLKLVALDCEDLEVLSAHLQDALLRVGDMAYLKKQKQFAAIANRFDWMGAQMSEEKNKKTYQRRRTALRFDQVRQVSSKAISLSDTDKVLELLAIQFEETNPPEGQITLQFAGGSAIRLHVDYIEAQLTDLGAVWRTKLKPEHADGDDGTGTDETIHPHTLSKDN